MSLTAPLPNEEPRDLGVQLGELNPYCISELIDTPVFFGVLKGRKQP